jgi:hypothetical protein
MAFDYTLAAQPRQNQKTRRRRPRLPAPVRWNLLDELTEVTRHRAAISEVLRAIAARRTICSRYSIRLSATPGTSAKPKWAFYGSASKLAFVWSRQTVICRGPYLSF